MHNFADNRTLPTRKNVLREPVEEVVPGVRHCVAVNVVREVVLLLVVPHHHLIRHVGRDRLQLPHELVAKVALILYVHILVGGGDIYTYAHITAAEKDHSTYRIQVVGQIT